ncbi:hypothetical protein [Streptomyces sp. NPDC007905]|uniref:hypothetical protein n=1 Tax=Streptomyces sp. NPDC007905 TaxID=3364788 RepID=UPI0036E4A2BC
MPKRAAPRAVPRVWKKRPGGGGDAELVAGCRLLHQLDQPAEEPAEVEADEQQGGARLPQRGVGAGVARSRKAAVVTTEPLITKVRSDQPRSVSRPVTTPIAVMPAAIGMRKPGAAAETRARPLEEHRRVAEGESTEQVAADAADAPGSPSTWCKRV